MHNFFSNINNRIAKTSFIFILIVIEIYFFINGRAHFSAWDETYGQLITIYLLMVVVFLLWSGRKTKQQMNKPLNESIGGFVGFFIATYFFLAAATYLSGDTISVMARELFWPTVIVQVCVVATSEELMFRGVLLEKFGIIVSSVLFALWHAYAYGVMYYMPDVVGIETIVAILLAFCMGIILAFVAKKWGLSSAIAIHACYNLFVSGAFITFSIM